MVRKIQTLTALVGINPSTYFLRGPRRGGVGGWQDTLITSGTLRASRLSPLQIDPSKSLSLSQLFFLSTQQRPRQLKIQGRVATQLLPSAFYLLCIASHRVAVVKFFLFFFLSSPVPLLFAVPHSANITIHLTLSPLSLTSFPLSSQFIYQSFSNITHIQDALPAYCPVWA